MKVLTPHTIPNDIPRLQTLSLELQHAQFLPDLSEHFIFQSPEIENIYSKYTPILYCPGLIVGERDAVTWVLPLAADSPRTPDKTSILVPVLVTLIPVPAEP